MANGWRPGQTLKALIDFKSEALGGLGAILGDIK
jgi:hypothetical protein